MTRWKTIILLCAAYSISISWKLKAEIKAAYKYAPNKCREFFYRAGLSVDILHLDLSNNDRMRLFRESRYFAAPLLAAGILTETEIDEEARATRPEDLVVVSATDDLTGKQIGGLHIVSDSFDLVSDIERKTTKYRNRIEFRQRGNAEFLQSYRKNFPKVAEYSHLTTSKELPALQRLSLAIEMAAVALRLVVAKEGNEPVAITIESAGERKLDDENVIPATDTMFEEFGFKHKPEFDRHLKMNRKFMVAESNELFDRFLVRCHEIEMHALRLQKGSNRKDLALARTRIIEIEKSLGRYGKLYFPLALLEAKIAWLDRDFFKLKKQIAWLKKIAPHHSSVYRYDVWHESESRIEAVKDGKLEPQEAIVQLETFRQNYDQRALEKINHSFGFDYLEYCIGYISLIGRKKDRLNTAKINLREYIDKFDYADRFDDNLKILGDSLSEKELKQELEEVRSRRRRLPTALSENSLAYEVFLLQQLRLRDEAREILRDLDFLKVAK